MAEFRDLSITDGDTVLYQNSLSENCEGMVTEKGHWEVVEGALRQTSNEQAAFCFLEGKHWKNYTVHCKARVLAGEGFMIAVAATGVQNHTRWQFGWNNTQCCITHVLGGGPNTMSPFRPYKLEHGRWYELRIEVRGDDVACFLGDEPFLQASSIRWKTVEAVASLDQSRQEVIVKIVTAQEFSGPLELAVSGIDCTGRAIRRWQLTDPNVQAENTLTSPLAVVPVADGFAATEATLPLQPSPCSVTLLRIPL